jgi:hypothetical protein
MSIFSHSVSILSLSLSLNFIQRVVYQFSLSLTHTLSLSKDTMTDDRGAKRLLDRLAWAVVYPGFPQNSSPITHHPSPCTFHPITHYPSLVTCHSSPIAHHPSPITRHSSITNHQSPITSTHHPRRTFHPGCGWFAQLNSYPPYYTDHLEACRKTKLKMRVMP